MVSSRSSWLATVMAGAFACVAGPAIAQGQLNVICSVQAEWCNLAGVEFEKETGIKTTMTLKGSGESMAQLAAERRTRNSTSGSAAPAIRICRRPSSD